MRTNKLAMTISAATLITFGTSSWAADLAVPNTFSPNTTISSSQMNANFAAVQTKVNAIMANTEGSALKTEVDKIQGIINNTQAGTLKTTVDGLVTDVTNLKQNVNTGSCGTGMARVGTTCIDTTRQGPNVSWITAVNTCRAADKRLPTAGELVAAHASGAITDLANDSAEHVDAIGTSASGQKMKTAYVGVNLTGLGSPGSGILQSREDADYDVQYNYIYFRCAR